MIKHFKIKRYFKKLAKSKKNLSIDNPLTITERYITCCIAFDIKPSAKTIQQLNNKLNHNK